jgi:hypothetical protein
MANTHFICEITTTLEEKFIKPNQILLPPVTDHNSKFYFINCCESGIFIPDAVRDIFPSRIPDPGSQFPQPNSLQPRSRIRTKEFKYFIQKKCFEPLENKIRVVHPESPIRMLTSYPSRKQGSKGIGSRIRIINTD